MFIPNADALLLRKQAKRSIHGKENYEPAVRIRCSVVLLADQVVQSSVRADQAASRGSAEQEVLQAKILILPHVKLTKGDVLQLRGKSVEITAVHQRFDVLGKHDHNEVGGNIKGDL
jgi:hypothetical protein